MLSPLEQGLLLVAMMLLMLGVGSSLHWEDFRRNIEEPKRICLGFFSQFGWMPLLAMGLALAFELSAPAFLALLMVGATPGGTTSNIFTFYARGDVSLSVCMTFASSMAAMVMTPLLVWLYYLPGHDSELVIPFSNIIASLGFVITPLAIGMFIRTRSEAWAVKIEKAGTFAGYAAALMMCVVWAPGFLQQIKVAEITIYGVMALMIVAGFIFGFGTAAAFKLDRPSTIAVAWETGMQNCPLTIAIITLSFDQQLAEQMIWIPVTYGAMSVSLATFGTIGLFIAGKTASS